MIEAQCFARTLGHALRNGGDFAEVFVEDRRSSSARSTTAGSKSWCPAANAAPASASCAVTPPGFAHTADLSPAGLLEAAEAAAAAAAAETGGSARPWRSRTPARRPHRPTVVLPETVEKRRKVELLARADAAARAESGAVTSVTASYADSRRRILVANSDGLLTGDDQVRTRFRCSASRPATPGCRPATRRRAARSGSSSSTSSTPERSARAAARRAMTLLDAVPAPSGRLPVVLRRGAGGVLFHEACGHGLEADLVRKDASVFAGRVGEQVASPLVTLVDDGTYGREWGTFAIDDEGKPAQRNVLDRRRRAHRLHVGLPARPQGGAAEQRQRAARQTYQHLPMVRMTNTFLLAGDDRSRRHRPRRRVRHLLRRSSAAARSTPRPATSCSASPRRT